MLSINPVIGQEKEEKRTIDKKTLVVENCDKGKKIQKQKKSEMKVLLWGKVF